MFMNRRWKIFSKPTINISLQTHLHFDLHSTVVYNLQLSWMLSSGNILIGKIPRIIASHLKRVRSAVDKILFYLAYFFSSSYDKIRSKINPHNYNAQSSAEKIMVLYSANEAFLLIKSPIVDTHITTHEFIPLLETFQDNKNNWCHRRSSTTSVRTLYLYIW